MAEPTGLATIKKPGHRFQPGHKHFPRHPKMKILRSAVETARAMGFDAIGLMLEIVTTGFIPELDGRKSPVTVPDRIKLLREASLYLVPKQTTTVTATVESRSTVLDVTALLMDPKLAEAAQNLALAMVEQEFPVTESSKTNYIAGD
jgi:hypothetical protein